MADVPAKSDDLIHHAVTQVRGQNVILDSDLAEIFGTQTKKLNQAVKRNAERFGEKYAFRMSAEEFEALRSQSGTSKSGRGGRRYAPWVFTDHGVVMAATVLDTERAIEASRLIVEVFVEVRRRLDHHAPTPTTPAATGPSQTHWKKVEQRLQAALDLLLDSVVDRKEKLSVREEAQNLIEESVRHLKDRLKKAGLENEEIAARVTKLLAESEEKKAVAARNHAETEAIEFQTLVRKLRLLMEANKAMAESQPDDFLNVLRDLSEQPLGTGPGVHIVSR